MIAKCEQMISWWTQLIVTFTQAMPRQNNPYFADRYTIFLSASETGSSEFVEPSQIKWVCSQVPDSPDSPDKVNWDNWLWDRDSRNHRTGTCDCETDSRFRFSMPWALIRQNYGLKRCLCWGEGSRGGIACTGHEIISLGKRRVILHSGKPKNMS